MIDSISGCEFYGFNFRKHDKFGGGKWEIVFADLDVGISKGHTWVFVENLVGHLNFELIFN